MVHIKTSSSCESVFRLFLFLLGNMYRLVMVRGFPQLSFLNLVEREMEILNVGLVGLALCLKRDVTLCFGKILRKYGSLSQTRLVVSDYDTECGVDISIIEHQRFQERAIIEINSDCNSTVHGSYGGNTHDAPCTYDVNYEFDQFSLDIYGSKVRLQQSLMVNSMSHIILGVRMCC